VGAFLEEIEGQAIIAHIPGLELQGLALGSQLLELLLLGGQGLAPLVGEQQPTLSGQGVESEEEDQERQGGGGQVGFELEKQRRLTGCEPKTLSMSAVA
jgi:hypothetical protein